MKNRKATQRVWATVFCLTTALTWLVDVGTAMADIRASLPAACGRLAFTAATGGCDYKNCPNEHNDPANPCPASIRPTGGGGLHVDIATGNVFTKVPILTAYGAGEESLNLELTYNSLMSNTDSGVGHGWTLGYDYHYYGVLPNTHEDCEYDNEGNVIGCVCVIDVPAFIVLVDGDGRHSSYYTHYNPISDPCPAVPNGFFTTPAGKNGTLIVASL